MAGQELRRMRRRARYAMRIREWPWRRKVALGAWVPVGVVAFILFTGPNGSSSGAAPEPAPRPTTVTTVKVGPPKANLKELSDRIRSFQQTQTDVSYWVNATPSHLTLQQQADMNRWKALRRRQLVQHHKDALAIANHNDQKRGR